MGAFGFVLFRTHDIPNHVHEWGAPSDGIGAHDRSWTRRKMKRADIKINCSSSSRMDSDSLMSLPGGRYPGFGFCFINYYYQLPGGCPTYAFTNWRQDALDYDVQYIHWNS